MSGTLGTRKVVGGFREWVHGSGPGRGLVWVDMGVVDADRDLPVPVTVHVVDTKVRHELYEAVKVCVG